MAAFEGSDVLLAHDAARASVLEEQQQQMTLFIAVSIQWFHTFNDGLFRGFGACRFALEVAQVTSIVGLLLECRYAGNNWMLPV